MTTLTKVYIHVVFSVKHRKPLILPSWEDEFHKYISGIIKGKNQHIIAINGMPDHIHLLIKMGTTISISELIREIKKASTNFVNNRFPTKPQFQWQEGYAAFGCSEDAVPALAYYILNQKIHHEPKEDFKEEYVGLLKENEIEFDEQYLFD
jgi:putative transposase